MNADIQCNDGPFFGWKYYMIKPVHVSSLLIVTGWSTISHVFCAARLSLTACSLQRAFFWLNPHCHTTESFTWSSSSHQQSWSWRKCEVPIRVVKCSGNPNILSFEGSSLLLKYYLGGAFICLLYFHPYLGRWSNLTNMFQMCWNHHVNTLLHIAALFLIQPLETAQRSILITIIVMIIIMITTNNDLYISHIYYFSKYGSHALCCHFYACLCHFGKLNSCYCCPFWSLLSWIRTKEKCSMLRKKKNTQKESKSAKREKEIGSCPTCIKTNRPLWCSRTNFVEWKSSQHDINNEYPLPAVLVFHHVSEDWRTHIPSYHNPQLLSLMSVW